MSTHTTGRHRVLPGQIPYTAPPVIYRTHRRPPARYLRRAARAARITSARALHASVWAAMVALVLVLTARPEHYVHVGQIVATGSR